jgi:hypothetical protein
MKIDYCESLKTSVVRGFLSRFRIKTFLTGALLCGLFSACAGSPASVSAQAASPPDELDAAIRETSDYLNKQLPPGNKLIILNIQSVFPALSEYIIDELIANTVNDRVFSVVDRQQLDTLRAELDFQMSGAVSDESAQNIGQMLGAQIIISGAVSRIGDLYRLRVRALSVQSAQIEGQFNKNIPEGPTVAALVRSRATGYGGGTAAAPNGSAARPPAGGRAAAPARGTATAPADSAPALDYQVGDQGPAGGWIFFDMGFYMDGWRYLEAAPQDFPTRVKWGDAFMWGGTDTGVGTGRRNTTTRSSMLKKEGENMRAAQVVSVPQYGGYDDWFLPSKDELNLMYENLKQKRIGNFSNDVYWSSSNEGGIYQAWQTDFSDGRQKTAWRNTDALVRAVRQF